MEDIADLDDEHEEHQEFAVLARVTGDREHQQGGDMTYEVDANHQAPLDGSRALEEMFTVTGRRTPNGQQDIGEHRNEDGKQPVPVFPDEEVLNRYDGKERPEQGAVVTGAGGGQRHKLAQGKK